MVCQEDEDVVWNMIDPGDRDGNALLIPGDTEGAGSNVRQQITRGKGRQRRRIIEEVEAGSDQCDEPSRDLPTRKRPSTTNSREDNGSLAVTLNTTATASRNCGNGTREKRPERAQTYTNRSKVDGGGGGKANEQGSDGFAHRQLGVEGVDASGVVALESERRLRSWRTAGDGEISREDDNEEEEEEQAWEDVREMGKELANRAGARAAEKGQEEEDEIETDEDLQATGEDEEEEGQVHPTPSLEEDHEEEVESEEEGEAQEGTAGSSHVDTSSPRLPDGGRACSAARAVTQTPPVRAGQIRPWVAGKGDSRGKEKPDKKTGEIHQHGGKEGAREGDDGGHQDLKNSSTGRQSARLTEDCPDHQAGLEGDGNHVDTDLPAQDRRSPSADLVRR